MKGWHGKFLRVNLSNGEITTQSFDEEYARKYLGGRGFAAKILWDELRPGVDPLGPENKLVFAFGPLTGMALPSSSKIVVAAKSPLTGGYGDGNLGTKFAVQLRKAGYDGIIIEGKADSPVYIHINDNDVNILPAVDLWGKGYYETHEILEKEYGSNAGIVGIGPAGENLVKFAVVRSQEGRAGGRPGMGAVMGSKNLKAIVAQGSHDFPLADPETIKTEGKVGYDEVKKASAYEHWMRQGTTMVLAWCNETSTLPVKNFFYGTWDQAKGIDGEMLEKLTIARYGCPRCNMRCGLTIKDENDQESELDYENIGMLGSNLLVSNLTKVGTLNRMADDYGLDTISLGSVMGFAAECSEKGIIDEKIEWGDTEGFKELVRKITFREGIGDLLAEGTKKAAEKLGNDTLHFAMQVKGLEVSAYNCYTTPGMALSFGTSPIGAHHKDAWVISWEVQTGRDSYGPEKAAKVIEFQRIRGGMFESLTTCRFRWIELGFSLDWYPKYLEAATGMKWTLDDLWEIGDRIYALIRAFWVREFQDKWSKEMDYPPERWFDPLPEGPLAGTKLEKEKYDQLLSEYYKQRGWDERGIPTKSTLAKLGLEEVALELENYVTLKE